MAIDVNAETTTALINAFEAAAEDQRNAGSNMGDIQAVLAGGWQGAASTAFTNNVDEWLAGLAKVRNALVTIQDNMVEFSKANTRTEDDNLQDASTWISEAPASWT
ncbi:WXG100 family type VII secretion target [Catenuloplanes japonicus]|uniref:WXG100 family type VII secretion target n=1 Tax=Catenuloplanes japonicus TaxID=33876 RepID=UPI00052618AA|nr:WXG100 family type VII secretion target [Catenuloplanes japonicus]